MKAKLFLAAALSASVLLSGCGESANESTNKSAASVAESTVSKARESSVVESAASLSDISESAVSSVESSDTESSKEVSSSSKAESSEVSVPQKPDYEVPTAKLDESSKIVDAANKTMTVSFTTDIPFRSDIEYYLRIYFTDSNLDESELRYDEPFDTSRTSLTFKLHEGNNYYYIQFHTDEKDGGYSNEIYQALGQAAVTPTNGGGGGNGGNGNGGLPSNVQRHTFEFYTMDAAMYGEMFETMYGYPDYSETDRYLSQGIQPEYIDVDVYYVCPLCDTETFCGTYEYAYNENDVNPIDTCCQNKRCRNYNEKKGIWLNSHVN